MFSVYRLFLQLKLEARFSLQNVLFLILIYVGDFPVHFEAGLSALNICGAKISPGFYTKQMSHHSMLFSVVITVQGKSGTENL